MAGDSWELYELLGYIWSIVNGSAIKEITQTKFKEILLYQYKIEISDDRSTVTIYELNSSNAELDKDNKRKIDLGKTSFTNRYWYLRYSSFLGIYILNGYSNLHEVMNLAKNRNFTLEIPDGYIDEEGIISFGYGIISDKDKMNSVINRFPELIANKKRLEKIDNAFKRYDEFEAEILGTPIELFDKISEET